MSRKAHLEGVSDIFHRFLFCLPSTRFFCNRCELHLIIHEKRKTEVENPIDWGCIEIVADGAPRGKSQREMSCAQLQGSRVTESNRLGLQ
ncbi:hypothetical protein CBR_g38247 [Chara braunii]|uniref:Uncharacterized protein n=1 Tax=Chara braunii TaxID=69332 RepID=A0A388LPK4_CHABU|nr:hypothetical protein CBR_g38247 [Chara braunii]|eukprot:GBG84276.1 hypothetical protein CBR_g38247 [Chara braunii]